MKPDQIHYLYPLFFLLLLGCPQHKQRIERANSLIGTSARVIDESIESARETGDIGPRAEPFPLSGTRRSSGNPGFDREDTNEPLRRGGEGGPLGLGDDLGSGDPHSRAVDLLGPLSSPVAKPPGVDDPEGNPKRSSPRRGIYKIWLNHHTGANTTDRSEESHGSGLSTGFEERTKGDTLMDTASLVFLDIWTFVWAQLGLILFGWVLARTVGATLVKDLKTLADKIARDETPTP